MLDMAFHLSSFSMLMLLLACNAEWLRASSQRSEKSDHKRQGKVIGKYTFIYSFCLNHSDFLDGNTMYCILNPFILEGGGSESTIWIQISMKPDSLLQSG